MIEKVDIIRLTEEEMTDVAEAANSFYIGKIGNRTRIIELREITPEEFLDKTTEWLGGPDEQTS